MTTRDTLLPIVDAARAKVGQLGFRQHTVTLVTRSYSGDHTGDGTTTETTTPLRVGGQPPKVRPMKADIVAMMQLPQGSITVGPLTPEFSGGGTSIAAIAGSNLETGNTYFLRVTSPMFPNGKLYRIVRIHDEKPLRYMIDAEPAG